MTTLYVHGFASSGRANKAEQLRAILDDEVLSPSLTHRPKSDIETLEAAVREHKVTTVVGSSLGGFYALYLGRRFDLRLVLINPSLRAQDTTRRYLGTCTVFDTAETFEWTEKEVDELREIGKVVEEAIGLPSSSPAWSRILLLLAERDEVLDARATATSLAFARAIVDPDADHRFADLSPHAEAIRKFATGLGVAVDSAPVGA